jgi:hypothetical protein
MAAVPKLGDLSPTKSKFSAGERVIARVNQALSSAQKKKICQGINQYAGVELNALIVDCSTVELIRFRGEDQILVAGRFHYARKDGRTLTFGCSKVDFMPGDSFTLAIRYQDPGPRNAIKEEVKRWIGDHKITIIPWTA